MDSSGWLPVSGSEEWVRAAITGEFLIGLGFSQKHVEWSEDLESTGKTQRFGRSATPKYDLSDAGATCQHPRLSSPLLW